MENEKTINNKLIFFIIAVLGIIIYHQVLPFHFINWDDNFYIIHNSYIREITFSNISHIFTHYYYKGVYEPLQLLSYMFIYSIDGLNPLWFHVFNAAIFIADAMLVYVFVKKIETPFVAVIAAVLFLLAPVNVDSAAWVSELKNTQSLFFVLIALIEYNAFLKGNNKYTYVISLLAFLFALLTKQTVATIVVIMLLLEWYIYNKPFVKTFFNQLPFYILAAVSIPVFMIGQILMHSESSRLWGGDLYHHILTFTANIAGVLEYPNKIILPMRVTNFYPPFPIHGFFTPRFIISLIALIVFIYIFRSFYKKRHTGFFWMSWYFVNMIPAFGIISVPFFTNWYLFLPSIGVYTLLALGLERIYNTQAIRKSGIAITAIIILVFGGLTYQRVGVWENDIHLWKDAIKKLPDYYFGYEEYAETLVKNNKIPQAIRQAKISLKLNPYNAKLLSGLGTYYLKNKDYDKALPYIKKAVKYKSGNVNYRYLLATYYKKIKDYTNYEKELRISALRDPYNLGFVNELAQFYISNEQTNKAIKLIKEIVSMHPNNASFYRVLGAYYLKYTNNSYKAKKAFERSLLLDPHQKDVKTLRQIIKRLSE